MNKMNKVNLMFRSYDNNYNTMYRYYYGAAVNTYKMSTHTRFPESGLYNKPQMYLINNPPATIFIEPARNTCIDIISSYKEQYSEDEWKVLSDAIAQEGQRLLEEEQEERFLWQERHPIQPRLSLIIPKDDDDELTDDDDCRELTDDDADADDIFQELTDDEHLMSERDQYISSMMRDAKFPNMKTKLAGEIYDRLDRQLGCNTNKMANLGCGDAISTSNNSQESNDSWQRWTRMHHYDYSPDSE